MIGLELGGGGARCHEDRKLMAGHPKVVKLVAEYHNE